jgi:hypothetical protein
LACYNRGASLTFRALRWLQLAEATPAGLTNVAPAEERQKPLRQKPNFMSDLNLIWVVQSCREKYSA